MYFLPLAAETVRCLCIQAVSTFVKLISSGVQLDLQGIGPPFPLISCCLALISDPFPPLRYQVALIRDLLPRICDAITLVRRKLPSSYACKAGSLHFTVHLALS